MERLNHHGADILAQLHWESAANPGVHFLVSNSGNCRCDKASNSGQEDDKAHSEDGNAELKIGIAF